jgi:hypothetical protein
VRRDIRDERSHSMPIPQIPGTEPITKTSNKVIEAKTDPRDRETELESKSIAIHAPICTGTLHPKTDMKSFTLVAKPSTDYIAFTDTAPKITLDAFLDESPTDLDLFPHSVHFLILTATANTTPGHTSRVTAFGLGLTIDEHEYDSDSDSDPPPKVTTYSGAGILLIHSEEYLRRGEFQTKAAQATEKFDAFKEQSGQIVAGSSEEWAYKNLEQEAKALKNLVVQLEKFKGTVEEQRHFRRMGVVEFRDWSEGVYREMMGQACGDIWLD